MSDYIDYTQVGDMAVSTIRLPAAYGRAIAETVVFRGPLHNRSERYLSVAEAEDGHRRWVSEVRATAR